MPQKDPIVEEVIRKELKKPTGELTKADLAKVTKLDLERTQITAAGLKEVAKRVLLEAVNLQGYSLP